MRITTRIFAAGKRSLTRIPCANAPMEDCLKPDGKLDEAKAQLAFASKTTAEYWPFMPADSDDVYVYSACLMFLKVIHEASGEVVAREDNDCRDHAETRQDALLEKRMGRGKYVFARANVRRVAEGVRVTLSIANPNGVPGDSIVEAQNYNVTCAQIWMRIMAQYPWITLDADEETLATARANNERAADRREYAVCERRVNGYCSPVKCDCKFYKDGKCTFKN